MVCQNKNNTLTTHPRLSPSLPTTPTSLSILTNYTHVSLHPYYLHPLSLHPYYTPPTLRMSCLLMPIPKATVATTTRTWSVINNI